MLNSILQPIGRVKFILYYAFFTFLPTLIIIIFLKNKGLSYKDIDLLLNDSSTTPISEESFLLVKNYWWFIKLFTLVHILLFYKRIRDIIDTSSGEINYYFLLLIPVFSIFLEPMVLPEFIAKSLSFVLNIADFLLLIFLVLKKGKSSSY